MADVARRRPKVFHVGGHKAGLCLSGWEGEVVGYADEGADGAKVSANLPIKVRFQRDQGGGKKPLDFVAHLRASELSSLEDGAP